MKKLVISMLILCAGVLLTGCNAANDSAKEEAIETVTEEIASEVHASTPDIYSSELIGGLKNIQGFEFTNEAVNAEFNKKADETGEIPEGRLYSFAGVQNSDAEKAITSAAGTQFKQPSYIPSNIDFQGSDNDILLYSMLYDNFKFYTPFPVITGGFAYASGFYKYFGHFPETRNKTAITNNISYIEPLFYASDEDFGLKIQDPLRKEEMLLYLTESNASFDELYSELMNKAAQKKEFEDKKIAEINAQSSHGVSVRFESYYKIPFINITKLYNYDGDYKNKGVKIGGKPGTVKNALGVVRIKINNEESKERLSSSSYASVNSGGYAQVENRVENRLYYFDRPFVLFLRKAGCDKPYFAVRIKDGKYLLKHEQAQK